MSFRMDFVSQHVDNWMKWLGHFIDKRCHALEIGSYEGRSSIWFCKNILTESKSTLTCVDIHSSSRLHSTFMENTAELRQSGKIRYFRERSADFLFRRNTRQYDFIYVDGNHKGKQVLQDSVLGWEALAPEGIMFFDDYGHEGRDYDGLRTAVDAFLSCYAKEYHLIETGYQVAVSKVSR